MMNQPPLNQFSPESVPSLLKLMRAGQKEIYEVKLGEAKIYFRILTSAEKAGIRRQAVVNSKGDEFERNRIIQLQTLYEAAHTDKTSVSQLPLSILEKLTVDELQYFYAEYIRIEEVVNPNIETMTEDQFRTLVEALKKSHVTWKDLSIPQLKEICKAFVDLIQRLEIQDRQKVNLSGG